MKIEINKYILSLLISPLLFAACEMNDPIDELMKVGNKAPHVYWEIPSSTATAGQGVNFKGQYYADGVAIDRLEVWYDINEKQLTTISCPLTVTFKFSMTTDSTKQSRIFQSIQSYPHDEKYWDKDKKAYQLNTFFPTSNTLRLVEWKEVQTYDDAKFKSLFPKNADVQFKDSLYKLMKVSDFRKIMVGTESMTPEEFKTYTDSTWVENSGAWNFFIKPELVASLKQKYDLIPFQKLIYDASSMTYKVEYSKQYFLNARLKAFDVNKVEGYSEMKLIELR